MKKKLVSIVLAVVMLCGLMVPAFAADSFDPESIIYQVLVDQLKTKFNEIIAEQIEDFEAFVEESELVALLGLEEEALVAALEEDAIGTLLGLLPVIAANEDAIAYVEGLLDEINAETGLIFPEIEWEVLAVVEGDQIAEFALGYFREFISITDNDHIFANSVVAKLNLPISVDDVLELVASFNNEEDSMIATINFLVKLLGADPELPSTDDNFFVKILKFFARVRAFFNDLFNSIFGGINAAA